MGWGLVEPLNPITAAGSPDIDASGRTQGRELHRVSYNCPVVHQTSAAPGRRVAPRTCCSRNEPHVSIPRWRMAGWETYLRRRRLM